MTFIRPTVGGPYASFIVPSERREGWVLVQTSRNRSWLYGPVDDGSETGLWALIETDDGLSTRQWDLEELRLEELRIEENIIIERRDFGDKTWIVDPASEEPPAEGTPVGTGVCVGDPAPDPEP
jgi:hypothetical protein